MPEGPNGPAGLDGEDSADRGFDVALPDHPLLLQGGGVGRGVKGVPTRTTGASSVQNPSSTARAAISAPMPKSRTASCAITSRLVFPREPRTVSQSMGATVRRSTTSTEMPSAASDSATARLSRTMRETLTTVTSVPSRSTFALPIGTTWSGENPGPDFS